MLLLGWLDCQWYVSHPSHQQLPSESTCCCGLYRQLVPQCLHWYHTCCSFAAKIIGQQHMVTADYLQVVTGPISASVAFLLEVAMALMTCAELLRIGGHLSANLTMDTCSWCSVDIAGQCQVLSWYDTQGPVLQYTTSHISFRGLCILCRWQGICDSDCWLLIDQNLPVTSRSHSRQLRCLWWCTILTDTHVYTIWQQIKQEELTCFY